MGGAILMPYYHCRTCHHEFEYLRLKGEPPIKCDWCGADEPTVLEEKTPLEKLCDHLKEKGFN